MRNTILFILGLLLATWFAVIGLVWFYLVALYLAYPAGLLALTCWLVIRKDNKWRNRFIPIILITGLIASLSVLIYLLYFN